MFFFLLQDAIEHNSYITEERKLEKGDIEKGFKSADKIIEGGLCMWCIRRGRGKLCCSESITSWWLNSDFFPCSQENITTLLLVGWS